MHVAPTNFGFARRVYRAVSFHARTVPVDLCRVVKNVMRSQYMRHTRFKTFQQTCVLLALVFTVLRRRWSASNTLMSEVSSSRKPCDLPSVNKKCTRVLEVLRSSKAGLGHQIEELVFSLKLSQIHSAALVYRPFSSVVNDHNEDLSFVDEFLGLNALSSTEELSAILNRTGQLPDQVAHDECGVHLETSYQMCSNNTNCFFAREMSGAFDTFSACLRNLSSEFGTWLARRPVELDESFLNLVWHVRLGDLVSYTPKGSFYTNIASSLQPVFFAANHVVHHFVASWDLLTPPQRRQYESDINETFQNTHFVSVNLEKTLLYFLHADILVGSGSSLPRVAGLFSHIPLVVNVKPFHGWNFKAEYFSDGIDVDDAGYVRTPLRSIFNMLETKGMKHKFRTEVFNTHLRNL